MKIPLRLAAVLFLLVGIAAGTPIAADDITPRFADPHREQRLRAVLPEIDQVFNDFARSRPTPGLVWGIVLDGRLIHTGATGLANVEAKLPAHATETRFRIASMTKSITALAILKLRDAGKLALHDPVEKYLPEFRGIGPLTSDSPVITVRHLLTMTAGFPEDNPWGDRQLAQSVDELRNFLRDGVSLSNPPGIRYEYSNLGYALLGQIIAVITGEPYQRYITREIFAPLGMKDTRWEYDEIPAEQRALGYRRADDAWRPEPLLHDGTYGAMGGVWTTIPDFARYVSFHLDAWPARNAPDTGPVRRSTRREMQKPSEMSTVLNSAKTLAGELNPQAVGYGYGLRWTMDSKRVIAVGHSGGLPGFGSHYLFYPDHGVAVISFANITYASTSAANYKAAALLIEKAALPARVIPVSPILQTRKQQVAELVQSWDAKLGDTIAAENFFLDRSRTEWSQHAGATLAKAGAIRSVGDVVAENQLRGTFPLVGERGRVDVFFTLTPEKTPKLQELRLTYVPNP